MFLAIKHCGICPDITVVSTNHQRTKSSSYSSLPQSQVIGHVQHAGFLLSTPAEEAMNTTSNWVFPRGIFTTGEMHDCQNISVVLKRKSSPCTHKKSLKELCGSGRKKGHPLLNYLMLLTDRIWGKKRKITVPQVYHHHATGILKKTLREDTNVLEGPR